MKFRALKPFLRFKEGSVQGGIGYGPLVEYAKRGFVHIMGATCPCPVCRGVALPTRAQESETIEEPAEPAPRRRGRPPGSKNKPKEAMPPAPVDSSATGE